MSTRCQIGFYSQEQKLDADLLKPVTLLYKHCDGYPDTDYGILQTIVPFLRKFDERRGLSDIEYAAAWLLHHLVALHVEQVKGWAEDAIKQGKKAYAPLDGLECMGYGICPHQQFQGDIAYYYAIQGTKLKVYKTNLWDDVSLQGFKCIQTVDIAEHNNQPADSQP